MEEDWVFFLMFISWISHLSALWVCMRNRHALESSEAKCQLLSKIQNSRRVNNCTSWGVCSALQCLLGLGRMTSPPDNIDGCSFWASSLLGIAWTKTLCIQRIPFSEDLSFSKNSRESYFVVAVFIFQAILMLPWAFFGLQKKPDNQAFVLASNILTSQQHLFRSVKDWL